MEPDRQYLDRHVALLNEGVRSGDFGPFLDTFADDAVMRFEGVPVEPFVGRAAIEAAYQANPPDDTMRLTSTVPANDGILARFSWHHGGEGFFILALRDGKVTRLDVSFLPETASAWT